jgi:hypothetical protein
LKLTFRVGEFTSGINRDSGPNSERNLPAMIYSPSF